MVEHPLKKRIMVLSVFLLALALAAGGMAARRTEAAFNGLPPCRFGITAPLGVSGYETQLQELGVCALLNWGASRPGTLPSGIEYVPVLRVSDTHYPGSLSSIDTLVPALPGAMWIIGNEPDTCYPVGDPQDCLLPETYAERFYELGTAIRALDPTARLGFAPVVQPTPIRMRYLDRAWTRLVELAGSEAGASALIDAWTIHAFILNEWPLEWGTGVPPGFEDDYADAIHITDLSDTHDNSIFEARLSAFRTWMYDKGEGDKPLWITEYGSLFPPIDPPVGPDPVNVSDMETARYMRETFDYLLSATDPTTGYALDGDRLVQRWFWYSLNDHRYNFGGTLHDPDYAGARTTVGLAFLDTTRRLYSGVVPVGESSAIIRFPPMIQNGTASGQWFARLTPSLTGEDGKAFRFMVWLQLPETWSLPWGTQYSYSGDFQTTTLQRDFGSLWFVQNQGLCPQGGTLEPGYKWRAWMGPLESYPAWLDRLGNELNLRGGIAVPIGADPGVEALRVVIGTFFDSDGDSVPDTYACHGVQQSPVVVE